MSIFSGTQGAATKRCFNCITICNSMHPNNNSSCSFLIPLDLEFTTFKRKLSKKKVYFLFFAPAKKKIMLTKAETYLISAVFMNHQGENLLGEFLFLYPLILATINKNIVLPWMSVHITVHGHTTLVNQSETRERWIIVLCVATGFPFHNVNGWMDAETDGFGFAFKMSCGYLFITASTAFRMKYGVKFDETDREF